MGLEGHVKVEYVGGWCGDCNAGQKGGGDEKGNPVWDGVTLRRVVNGVPDPCPTPGCKG